MVEISKSAFLKRADAICQQAYDRVAEGFRRFVRGRKDEAFADIDSIRRYADTVLLPAKRQQLEELRALGAPSEDEDQVEAILDAYEDGIQLAEDDPRAAVTSTFGVFVEATELAEEYGLENCRY